jgi:hypothetical protein
MGRPRLASPKSGFPSRNTKLDTEISSSSSFGRKAEARTVLRSDIVGPDESVDDFANAERWVHRRRKIQASSTTVREAISRRFRGATSPDSVVGFGTFATSSAKLDRGQAYRRDRNPISRPILHLARADSAQPKQNKRLSIHAGARPQCVCQQKSGERLIKAGLGNYPAKAGLVRVIYLS